MIMQCDEVNGRVMRQYRACVIDILGVGIMYVCYIIVLAMCRIHPDLVSFAFSAIPIFYILIFNLFVSSLFWAQ